MNDVQTKWLGGCTAETYIAGAVGFKYRDNDGKPQYKKIHYWKTGNGFGDLEIYEILNSHLPMDEQKRKKVDGVTFNYVSSMAEVINH